MRRFILPWCLIAVAGCAHPDLLRTGMTRDQLDARFGRPAAVRHDPDGDVRIYSSAPLGQRASAVHLDANGVVFRVEPVLNTEHFATIVVGRWTEEQILTHFGRPAERTRIPGYAVWSFRYRESEQYDSMFHVMFDQAGIVRRTENGPDPMYEIHREGRD